MVAPVNLVVLGLRHSERGSVSGRSEPSIVVSGFSMFFKVGF